MTVLSWETQKALLAELEQRDQIKRYYKARLRTVMAREHGYDLHTIASILETGQARFLTTKQYAVLQQKERERLKAQDLLRDEYSYEAIGQRTDTSAQTARRYYKRHFQEQSELPMCLEQCRRAG